MGVFSRGEAPHMKNEILSYCKCLTKYICRYTLDSFFPTKFGRAGRDGQPSVCILLRKKKERTPAELKAFLNTSSTTCLKRGLSKIFSLSDPDGKSSKNLPRMTRSALTNLNSSSCSCVRHRRCVGSMQRGLRCSWKLPVFQVLVIKSSSATAVSQSLFLRCCYTCMMTCTSCPSGTSGRELGCEEAIETILGLRSESHK